MNLPSINIARLALQAVYDDLRALSDPGFYVMLRESPVECTIAVYRNSVYGNNTKVIAGWVGVADAAIQVMPWGLPKILVPLEDPTAIERAVSLVISQVVPR